MSVPEGRGVGVGGWHKGTEGRCSLPGQSGALSLGNSPS